MLKGDAVAPSAAVGVRGATAGAGVEGHGDSGGSAGTKSHTETKSLDRWLAMLSASRDPLVLTLAGLGLVAESLTSNVEPNVRKVARTLRSLGLELDAELGHGNAGSVMLAVPTAAGGRPPWVGKERLAVKMLRSGKTSGNHTSAFRVRFF